MLTANRIARIIGRLGGLAALALLFGGVTLTTHDTARGAPGKDPPTVFGAWALNCECARGMVVNIAATSRDTAKGRVKVVGRASQFNYRLGEEILRLKNDGSGTWNGEVLWRNTAGEHRWQPISMRLNGERLHGTSANEHCYEYMERSR